MECSIARTMSPDLSSPTPLIFPASSTPASSALHASFSDATLPANILASLEQASTLSSLLMNITVQSSDALSSDPFDMRLVDYLNWVSPASTSSLPASTTFAEKDPSVYFFGFTYSPPWSDLLALYAPPDPLRPYLEAFYGDFSPVDPLGVPLLSSPSFFPSSSPPASSPPASSPPASSPPASSLDDKIATSLGISGSDCGVSFHTHGPVLSHQIHGRKTWLLYDPLRAHLPSSAPFPLLSRALSAVRLLLSPPPSLHLDPPFHDVKLASTRFLEMLTSPSSLLERLLLALDPPFACTVEADEVLYIPDGWIHATVNEADYNLFVSSFYRTDLK